jgi:hypothetical protein
MARLKQRKVAARFHHHHESAGANHQGLNRKSRHRKITVATDLLVLQTTSY